MPADLPLLPVLTIGGYLGAGKTTLVNNLLRHANGRRLAVLVNEFGDLAIDEDLIEAEEDNLISIAGGCICCSFGNDLMGALKDMTEMEPRPDHVIIESSGVAIPGAIVATMSLMPGLQSDGVIVVVDAETVRSQAADKYIGDTILRQLADAEGIVINKSDLVDEGAALSAWLDQVAEGAFQVPTQFGKVAPEAILGVIDAGQSGRDGGHSDALFESLVLQRAAVDDVEALARSLATGCYGVVRAKGYVHGPNGALWLVQTVGQRWEARLADGGHEAGVVCIGLRGQLAVEALAGVWAIGSNSSKSKVLPRP
ncbi:MAG: CobW family GTP-binding protein [Pikeienuella sp.]